VAGCRRSAGETLERDEGKVGGDVPSPPNPPSFSKARRGGGGRVP
jgi:hypothetical protein